MTKKNRKTFLNDEDGLSAKDYLLIVSSTIFFLFITIGLILVLFSKNINTMYLSLLEMIVPVIMTIVGGIFSVNVADTIVSRKDKKESKTEYEDDI